MKFFALTVKPKITRGKHMWNPLNNQMLSDTLYCIRDKDVNCFLLKINDGYIAVDSGYPNSENVKSALKGFQINPNDVKYVFLTHLDYDHAGGINRDADIIYPNAEVYLSSEEEKYLKGCYTRKKILWHNCKLPLSLNNGYHIFNDNELFELNGCSIRAVLTPGHSLGHTAFIVNDNLLFSGDCIIANEEGGYSFFDFWNQDSTMNLKSLKRLKSVCAEHTIECVATSHSGCMDFEKAFRHIDNSPEWKKNGFVFCKNADDDPYLSK